MSKIRGIEDLKKDLDKFEKKVVGKIIRTALRDGAMRWVVVRGNPAGP